jgi:ATP-dependent Clp protease ATP-binding subunit ClpA
MIDNFTDEYKKIMLETEIHTKQFGYKEILPEDVFLQVSAIHEGNMYDFFTSFGINHVIIQDVLTRPPFLDNTVTRNGTYTGISVRLKAVILLSVQIASQFGKAKAGIEDFLIALMTSKDEQWIYQILDFVGISPKDFESQLVDMNKLIASHTT